MEETLEIPKALRDAIMSYLIMRPFREVADAVIALQQLKPIEKSDKRASNA